MRVRYVSLLRIQRQLQDLPRNYARFQQYLRTVMNPEGTDAMTSFAARLLSLFVFPVTRQTPGIAAKRVGSSSAAQPVTRIFAPGVSLWARRIA